jgi:small conductance mechanosensitive channel
VPLLADTFLERHDHVLTAVLSILVAGVLIFLVDRMVKRRGQALRAALPFGARDPVLDTRLRFVRRLLEAAIAVVGLGVALSQFAALDRLATSILASGALAAAVIGFAARQTLANAVAGVMLFITQPVRIGDLVTFEGQTGTVEDVRLAYTWLRTAEDVRFIVPNERLAAGVINNSSIVTPTVLAEVVLWIPARADADRAVELLAEEGETRLTDMDADGRVQVTVAGTREPAPDRFDREAQLRAACLRRLREAGMLGPA